MSEIPNSSNEQFWGGGKGKENIGKDGDQPVTNCHGLKISINMCSIRKTECGYWYLVFTGQIILYMRHCGDSVPTMSDIYTLCICGATVRKFRTVQRR